MVIKIGFKLSRSLGFLLRELVEKGTSGDVFEDFENFWV